MLSKQDKKSNSLDLKSVLPNFTIEDLIRSGCHFGHTVRVWNPNMKKFIFGTRNGIHIIDLRKTHEYLTYALSAISSAVRSGKTILMVSTKGNVREIVKKCSIRSCQPYVDYRWLGGMLTNWGTVALSIKKIKRFEKTLSELDEKGRHHIYTKKEIGVMKKELAKLKLYFEGLRGVTSRPDMMIVFDVIKDKCAIQEAEKLGIEVVGIVDTNSSLQGVKYPIPCNDDSMNSIEFISKVISDTIINSIKKEVEKNSKDIKKIDSEKDKKNDEIVKKIKDSVSKSKSKVDASDGKSENPESPESSIKEDFGGVDNIENKNS